MRETTLPLLRYYYQLKSLLTFQWDHCCPSQLVLSSTLQRETQRMQVGGLGWDDAPISTCTLSYWCFYGQPANQSVGIEIQSSKCTPNARHLPFGYGLNNPFMVMLLGVVYNL